MPVCDNSNRIPGIWVRSLYHGLVASRQGTQTTNVGSMAHGYDDRVGPCLSLESSTITRSIIISPIGMYQRAKRMS